MNIPLLKCVPCIHCSSTLTLAKAQKYYQVTACAIVKTDIQVPGYVRREMRTYSL